jgi:hypothetical protein
VQTSGAGGTLWPDEFDGDWEQIDLVILDTYHYCVVDIGQTELTLTAIDLGGSEIDSFTIQAQPRDGQSPPGPLPSGPTQWDFGGGRLASSYGPGTLEFLDGAGGPTAQQTAFGTTASFGLPAIGGQVSGVMRFPRATANTMGFTCRHGTPANGGEFTLLIDMLIPSSSYGPNSWLGVFNTNCCNQNDADVFIRLSDGAIGISGSYHGQIPANQWRRIGLVFDLNAANQVELIKYVNGVEAGRQNLGGIDGRWSVYSRDDAWPWFHLFTDDTNDAASAFVSSLYFIDRPLAAGEVFSLGGPDADGILPDPCPGDLNLSGEVDLNDLAALLSHFGTSSGATHAHGDMDGDGTVDLSDLAALLARFGTVCS